MLILGIPGTPSEVLLMTPVGQTFSICFLILLSSLLGDFSTDFVTLVLFFGVANLVLFNGLTPLLTTFACVETV